VFFFTSSLEYYFKYRGEEKGSICKYKFIHFFIFDESDVRYEFAP